MFVSDLKKNLVSITFLEDYAYDMIFIKGNTFLRHIVTGKVKQIVLRMKNLYNLDVDDCVALSTKVEKV